MQIDNLPIDIMNCVFVQQLSSYGFAPAYTWGKYVFFQKYVNIFVKKKRN